MLFKAWCDCSKPLKCQEGEQASVKQDDEVGGAQKSLGIKQS